MAIWSVIASKIKLFPHPNADRMLIAKVGFFQLVVAKDNGYQDDDVIIFAPERAILPKSLCPVYCNSETGLSYLIGPENNRVKQVRLRGEISEGVTIPWSWIFENTRFKQIEDVPLDVDIAEDLGITKYEPPMPTNMSGILTSKDSIEFIHHVYQHDVEHYRLFSRELDPNENVNIFCKVHGSQGILLVSANGIAGITSKGYAKKDLLIEESDSNLYWKAFKNAGLIDFCREHFAGSDVQIFAEVIPCQGGYSYGQTTPTVRIFRFIANSREWCYNEIVEDVSTRKLLPLWVPLLYQGPLNGANLSDLCQGKEQVSGKELHIREGIVISPEIPRRTRQGFPLYLKFINPKFKSNDNDVS